LRVLIESPQYVKAYRYLENRIQKANIEKLKNKFFNYDPSNDRKS